MSFAAVFLYEVDTDAHDAFQSVYGADGEWARFFAAGEGYLGTELLRSGDRYLLIDRWTSRAAYEAFLAAHADEYARRIVSWETERTDRYNRFRWVVIDRLGKRPTDVALQDVNTYSPVPIMQRQLFEHDKPSGRVDATRKGNDFDVKTRGVQQFTLLLSPDVIDFTKPVKVTVNGKPAHDAMVKPDVTTMLTWAGRDHDRTMLYGAALPIVVP